ncbi:bifunctional helix-turn-helix transcriptional regulator/GNAT family N-acetyltransferase [Xylanimonas oleitrophica]|uniref:bifunctional helix-turn-helix transcriptional regulator/GNAT family N-acetyltransferase n=1 Tax=Xylanimonas oleitrophica TaxID=2607479 RepID=UPI001C54F87D|nr:helix-turn-helix domain-containing GNAT family N-acetyltransferase [Xylanimonas oleitrophica]
MTTDSYDVGVLRRFNRSYTQRIGVLDDSFLGTGMPLGTARLLFEIGTQPGTTRALRARLGLDSGYLSRLLRRLEREGLVAVVPDPADRRRRLVDLTDPGRAAWEELDRRSERTARTLLDPLTSRQRERLAAALAEADLLVRAATVELGVVDPRDPAARAAVGAYFAELARRFREDNVVDVGAAVAADARKLAAPHGAFVVAVSDGEAVACGGVHRIADGVAEIKRMWVHGGWRGAGLGSRLLRHLEGLAAERGLGVVRLDTNEELVEAIAMYERAGYRRIDRYNDNPNATHFYEKVL